MICSSIFPFPLAVSAVSRAFAAKIRHQNSPPKAEGVIVAIACPNSRAQPLLFDGGMPASRQIGETAFENVPMAATTWMQAIILLIIRNKKSNREKQIDAFADQPLWISTGRLLQLFGATFYGATGAGSESLRKAASMDRPF